MATDVDNVRLLIGDRTAPQNFSDSDLQTFLSLQSSSVLLAAAMALDALASQKGASLKEQRIGDFVDSSGKNQVSALQAQAEALRQIEYDTPAFDFAEENYNEFTQYDIIRNYILRTAP